MLFACFLMPRFKQIAQIQQLMSQKEQIRNMGIVAHIDHGKTTLADSLLAGAGLLSPQMAGTARVLDYLDEEQKRKITIKTANISILCTAGTDKFLINLVDTPGHVDFTGKVTRALRTIDGAIVLVDAVEEIMAQTEIVVRQALEERVRPVLFINKVDRLIVELQMGAGQIEQKLNHIISSFNDLIELYGEEPFKDEWKVDPAKGNVCFGSALHGWGFTMPIAKEKGIKFAEIISAYANQKQDELKKTLPVQAAVFEMAIRNLPNPKQAQMYRVEKIWSGPRYSTTGKALAECNDEDFAVACVTNVEAKSDQSSEVTCRLFSGVVKPGQILHCVNSQTETTVNKVYVSMGAFKEEVSQVLAGNIGVFSVSTTLNSGETLVDASHKAGMVPFEAINYVSEPVVTVAVEPKNPKDLSALLEKLEKLAAEDPNLAVKVNKETGEYLLSGMGELHLEVTLNELKSDCGFQVGSSRPRVVYREGVAKAGVKATAQSPNRQNKFTVQVEPQEEDKAKPESTLCVDDKSSVLSIDEYRNVLLDSTGASEQLNEEVFESVIAGFEYACKAGPLCGEPTRHVKVNLFDMKLSPDADLHSSLEVMHGVSKAIFGSFLTAQPVLLEPIYKTIITVSTDLAGECQRILTTRRGKTCAFEQKGLQAVITGFIPVSETFGFSKELRTTTSGRAFWQNILDHWEQVPEKLTAKIIAETRRRKGLPLDVPSASRFLEDT